MFYIKIIQKNKLLFLLSIISFFTTYAANWKAELCKKIKNGVIPAWMKKQIKSDLAAFVEGITRDIFDGQNSQCAHVSIVNDIIKIEWDSTCGDNESKCKILLRALEIICSVTSMPNLEFLVDLSDNPTNYEKKVGPIFCFVKKKSDRKGILLPDIYNLDFVKMGIDIFGDEVDKKRGMYSWKAKVKKAFWRGDALDLTTVNSYNLQNCYSSSRLMLVKKAVSFPKLMDAKISMFSDNCTQDFIKHYSNKKYLARSISIPKQLKYKYQITVDSCSSSWTSLRMQLFSNSMVLKGDSEYIQWYYQALKEGKHYISFSLEPLDIIEKIKWLVKNDLKARKIAQNSTEFARNNLRYSNMLYYIYCVLQQYAQLQKFTPTLF